MPDILVLLLLGTTVVLPLAALVRDTIEDVRGLVIPDDVPAAVELVDVLRVVRDAASDGGLEVMKRRERKEKKPRLRVKACSTMCSTTRSSTE